MFEWAIIGFLVGTALSLHFKMHVLFLVSFDTAIGIYTYFIT
jgi:hypothetical protein